MEGVAAGARGHHIGRDAPTGFAPASSPTTLLTPRLYLGCISAASRLYRRGAQVPKPPDRLVPVARKVFEA